MSSLVKAVKSINPNAKFILVGDDLNNIEWIEGTSPISISEIQTKINEIKQAEAHIYPRAKAYPSIQEQLDMQYWDKVNGTDNWEQAINAVKAQYPKN
jgi:hypothetical protein